MKQREPRRKVLIGGRMRVGASWSDVSILNVSSRGLMLQSEQAPLQGSYLDIRRGRHAIVARVVWSRKQRFGVRTQDLLNVEDLVREPDKSAPQARRPKEDSPPVERRLSDARLRAARERYEHSKTLARVMEFTCFGIAGLAAASAAYGMVAESLGRPLSEVGAAIGSR